jgi:hypothetical protein
MTNSIARMFFYATAGECLLGRARYCIPDPSSQVPRVFVT